MYVPVHIHIDVHIYIYVHVNSCIIDAGRVMGLLCERVCVCINSCLSIHVNICICMYIYANIYVHVCTYIYMHTDICIYIYTYIYIHMCMQTLVSMIMAGSCAFCASLFAFIHVVCRRTYTNISLCIYTNLSL